MKCKPVQTRYAPCWSGALMDPAFLRETMNDRAASPDVAGALDEAATSELHRAAFARVQAWWRRSLLASSVAKR